MADNVIFKVGTKEAFQAVEQKNVSTLYWLTDTQELYKGDLLFGTGKEATQTSAGLMSAADKAKLDGMSGGGTISGLTPVDASVIIADGEGGGKTIGVQLSKEPDNQIVLKGDGLFVGGVIPPEYTLEKQSQATEGYSATYRLKRTAGGESTYVGDAIDIPKDLVLQGGSVQTVTEANVPYEGAEVGDTYIDLVLNDPDSSHIYIPTKGIIDTEALRDTYVTKGLTSLSQGTSAENILAAIGSFDDLLAAVRANKVILDRTTSGGVEHSKAAIYATGNHIALNLTFLTASNTITVYQIQNVDSVLALAVTTIQLARKSELPDVSGIQGVIGSLPDEILSEIVNVQRTETTNSAEIRIFTKQDDGTYSPAEKHGVLTLIPAGQGPDGVSGAGLMSLADKQKLDSIDTDVISGLAESLTWGTL